jgi:hypothetical protein
MVELLIFADSFVLAQQGTIPEAQRCCGRVRSRPTGVTIEEEEDYMPTASSSITWSHDFDSALTQARANKRGILLDFTAAPM